MIEIDKLTELDVGRWVIYSPKRLKQKGKIKSWNDTFIFVIYNCDNDWDNFQNYTGQSTKPEDLIFLENEVNNV